MFRRFPSAVSAGISLIGSVAVVFGYLAAPASAASKKNKTTTTTEAKPTVSRLAPAEAPTKTVVGSTAVGAPKAGAYDIKSDVEKRIVDIQQQAAPELAVGKATCPDELRTSSAKIPLGTYSCSVNIAGVSAPYNVIVKEGGFLNSGVFQITPAKAIVSVAKIVDFIKTSLDPAEVDKAKVSCGKAKVIVGDPGTQIPCTITNNADVQNLVFVVRNVNGLVTLQEPATTTTAVGGNTVTTAVTATTKKKP
jgi:hypothetical protein